MKIPLRLIKLFFIFCIGMLWSESCFSGKDEEFKLGNPPDSPLYQRRMEQKKTRVVPKRDIKKRLSRKHVQERIKHTLARLARKSKQRQFFQVHVEEAYEGFERKRRKKKITRYICEEYGAMFRT